MVNSNGFLSGEENSCSSRTSPSPGRTNLSCVPSCPLGDQTTPTSAGEDLLPPTGEVHGQGCAGPRHQVLTGVTQELLESHVWLRAHNTVTAVLAKPAYHRDRRSHCLPTHSSLLLLFH